MQHRLKNQAFSSIKSRLSRDLHFFAPRSDDLLHHRIQARGRGGGSAGREGCVGGGLLSAGFLDGSRDGRRRDVQGDVEHHTAAFGYEPRSLPHDVESRIRCRRRGLFSSPTPSFSSVLARSVDAAPLVQASFPSISRPVPSNPFGCQHPCSFLAWGSDLKIGRRRGVKLIKLQAARAHPRDLKCLLI